MQPTSASLQLLSYLNSEPALTGYGRSDYGPKLLLLLVFSPFAIQFLAPPITEVEYIPPLVDSGFGLVTCFGHGKFGGLDVFKGLKAPARLGLASCMSAIIVRQRSCSQEDKTHMGEERTSQVKPSQHKPTSYGQGKLSPGGHWEMVPDSSGCLMDQIWL